MLNKSTTSYYNNYFQMWTLGKRPTWCTIMLHNTFIIKWPSGVHCTPDGHLQRILY